MNCGKIFLFQYKTKQNFRETKLNFCKTKRNFASIFVLQKETKFHIFLFRETQNFRETGEAFVSFRFSRNFKKAKIKNPSDASSQE
jgi:hypothetical protein